MTLRPTLFATALSALTLGLVHETRAGDSPVVVADHGGDSALPYYRALDLKPHPAQQADIPRSLPTPVTPNRRYREADMLPVRSSRLSTGKEKPRVIAVAGLNPFFLIGDDATSRAWLLARRDALRALRAVGFVVEVRTAADLEALRALAPGLTLVPASADDLAKRLGIRHYPVLVTPTAIEP